jgi:hypothetical protein
MASRIGGIRGVHREGSLSCSREMVIIWRLSCRNVSMLVCVTKIIHKRLSMLPVYCDWSLIWNRHGHECSRIWKLSGNFTLIQCIKKCRDFLGQDILGTTFFRAESSLIQLSCRSFIGVIVPYEISKVNFHVETTIFVSMSEEI